MLKYTVKRLLQSMITVLLVVSVQLACERLFGREAALVGRRGERRARRRNVRNTFREKRDR